jgi:Zn-dependent protease/CBS domain-containing protein
MQIGRVFGIPLRVDWSWLVVFALLVWTLSSNLGPFGSVPVHWRVPVAIVSVLTLFACVIAHEVAHAAVARAYGIRTREVVLFVFGGVSRMERVGVDARSEAKIAIAGPLTSFVLGAAFVAVASLLPLGSVAMRIFAYLAVINIVLAAFNLLPAYPMDGGRIVHAIAWGFTRSRLRSIRIAGVFSTIVGTLLALWGATLLFGGYTVQGVWTVLVAWFIIQTAQAEYVNETEIEPLEQLRCGDIADPPGESMAPETPCNAALALMETSRRRVVPVVAVRLLGVVTLTDFSKIERGGDRACTLASIMTPVEKLESVAPEVTALDALRRLSISSFHQLPVIDASGHLKGFVTIETIRRAVKFSVERARLGLLANENAGAVPGALHPAG